jgi:beta-lactamase regulating signal transducer with metallopeptidase domain
MSLIDALGWTLLHSLWQGAMLALLYGLLRWCLRAQRPQLRYALGLITLAALPIWAGLTLWQLWPSELVPLSVSQGTAETTPATDIETLLPLLAQPTATGEAETLSWQDRLRPALPYLGLGYLLGLSLMALRWTGGLWQIHRLRRSATAGPAEWQTQLTQWQRTLGLRRPVRLLISHNLSAPATVGFWKPVILIPASLLTGLSPAQWEAILLHELAHIHRADYLTRMIQSWIEILFFYHPLIGWVGSDLMHEREACCDDQAVGACGDAVRYALALTSLQRMCHPSNLRFVMNLQNKRSSSFARRMQRLFAPPAPTASPKAGLLLTLLLMVSVAALGWINLPPLPISSNHDFTLTIDHRWTRARLDAKVAELAKRDIVLQIDEAEVDGQGLLIRLSGSLIMPNGNSGSFSCPNLGRVVLRSSERQSPSITVDCKGEKQPAAEGLDESTLFITLSPEVDRKAMQAIRALLTEHGYELEWEDLQYDLTGKLRSTRGRIIGQGKTLNFEVSPGQTATIILRPEKSEVRVKPWQAGEPRDVGTADSLDVFTHLIKTYASDSVVLDGKRISVAAFEAQNLLPQDIDQLTICRLDSTDANSPKRVEIITKAANLGRQKVIAGVLIRKKDDSMVMERASQISHYIVDGEKMTVEEYQALNLKEEDIAETIFLYPKEEVSVGKSRFSTGGIVEVVTKAGQASGVRSSITANQASDPDLLNLENLREVDHIVVDEKPMSVAEFQALDLRPADITRVEVRKVADDEDGHAIDVIEVTTQAYLAQLQQSAEDSYFGLKALPNPTEGSFSIEVITSAESRLQVQVFDAQGRFITTLLDESRRAGTHRLTWDTVDLAPGTYLIYAQTEQHRGHQRVLLR